MARRRSEKEGARAGERKRTRENGNRWCVTSRRSLTEGGGENGGVTRARERGRKRARGRERGRARRSRRLGVSRIERRGEESVREQKTGMRERISSVCLCVYRRGSRAVASTGGSAVHLHPFASTLPVAKPLLLQFVLLWPGSSSLPTTSPTLWPRGSRQQVRQSLTPLTARTSRNHRIGDAVTRDAALWTWPSKRYAVYTPRPPVPRYCQRHVWTWSPLMNRDYALKKLRELRPSLKTPLLLGSTNPDQLQLPNAFRSPGATYRAGYRLVTCLVLLRLRLVPSFCYFQIYWFL